MSLAPLGSVGAAWRAMRPACHLLGQETLPTVGEETFLAPGWWGPASGLTSCPRQFYLKLLIDPSPFPFGNHSLFFMSVSLLSL